MTKERISVVQSQEGLVGGELIGNVVVSIPRGGPEKDLGVRTGELKESGSKVEFLGQLTGENSRPAEKGGCPATSVKRRLLRVWVRPSKPARMRFVRMS